MILFAADGYHWNGKAHDRRTEVTALQRSLPTLRATVHIPNLGLPDSRPTARDPGAPAHLGSDPGGVNVTWQQATVTGEVGELVVTQPMPSMPLSFWNDPDGARYRDAYFSAYPGVWRHGDWMLTTERGSVIISGRSDSTLNRHGVRLGSADIYDVVDKLPQVSEALVIGAELGDGAYWLVLFIVLADRAVLTGELTRAIKAVIAAQASPRHVPDDIIAVPAIPHTRTGATLGIVGFGRIGQALARRARGFAMRVLYHDNYRPPAEVEQEFGAEYRDLEDLLRESDFVSLHANLTPRTRHLINAERLAMMKPTAVLVNTSRGPVIDEQALAQALQQGQIFAAGLDVFEREPDVHPGLLASENAVLLPHLGSATVETRLAMANLAVDILLAGLEDRRPSALLNPQAWEYRTSRG